MTGLVIFQYYSEASNLAMSSVVANFSLLNKVYIPKYIFPLSKCLFVGINFLLTLVPLYALIIITGTPLNIYHLLLPFAFVCLILFTIGMGLILSSIAVFLRDLFYIYGVLITLWQYMTPIMYDFAIIPENLQLIFKFNPLFWFVKFARDIILFNKIPDFITWICCFGFASVFLIIGLIVFKKNQDKFIYYV
jgi:ABC-2 type transport system permease protein